MIHYFDLFQSLFWPLANPLLRTEEIEIQVMVYNRYLNNRPLGSTKFSLHRLLDEPCIQLAASLVDANDKPLKVKLNV